MNDYFMSNYYEVLQPYQNNVEYLVYTRDNILKEYFSRWSTQTKDLDKDLCIQDWIIINWAYPVTLEFNNAY